MLFQPSRGGWQCSSSLTKVGGDAPPAWPMWVVMLLQPKPTQVVMFLQPTKAGDDVSPAWPRQGGGAPPAAVVDAREQPLVLPLQQGLKLAVGGRVSQPLNPLGKA